MGKGNRWYGSGRARDVKCGEPTWKLPEAGEPDTWNSYVRFGGERSEKGWPRYHRKELLAGQSNKQYLAGPLPYFLQVTDLFFQPLFAFFIIELKSRKVIHVGVTRSPTDPWVAQQLREATPYGQAPKYLIRDNDSKFGSSFARVATTSAIEILKTPVHAPRANAICERFLRSVRQECLDHLLILHEKQLQRVLNEYVAYFNFARPHQGIRQQLPESNRSSLSSHQAGNKVIGVPIMGGLHHDYQRVA